MVLKASESIFEEIRKQGLPLIDRWIAEGYREDLHLDFKRKANPDSHYPDENDKKNYAKALSGFANSDGGVIIWGVDAPGVGKGVREKMPIKGIQHFMEHLDSLASRMVAPQVEGVVNHVILESDDIGYGVTWVPRSLTCPHRAEHHSSKKYYQRSGDSFVQLEHWQLEYMFGRRLVPDLKVTWEAIPLVDSRILSEGLFRGRGKRRGVLKLQVQNKGRAISRYGCLRIYFKPANKSFSLLTDRNHKMINYGSAESSSHYEFVEVTARANPGLVIYPSDRVTFFKFEVEYDPDKLTELNIPNFSFFYDLFGENFEGIIGQKMVIPGDAISRRFAGLQKTVIDP